MADAATPDTPVLIVGAGPTGLVLALGLARRGVAFRIVSEAEGPGEHSRAMVVHARTLEFYRAFGWADEVVAAGVRVEGARMRSGGREAAAFGFGDLGAGLSPYPFPLAYPQDDHERFLLGKLQALGVRVAWRTRLDSFTQDVDGVTARLAGPHGVVEQLRAAYLCGCDGAHSAVRRMLGIGFPGGTYRQLYFVADCETEGGFETDLVMNLGRDAFTLLLPVRSRGVQRLIGLVPPSLGEREDVGFEDLRAEVEEMIGRRVTALNWFSTYRVHHRVAERFQKDRAFLLGDAGHVHSPAGGQGMNTGIGDAVNLGWKLAMVAGGRAPPGLLTTYEAERIGFARTLVATTDRAFTAMVAGGAVGAFLRGLAVPLMFSLGTRLAAGRRAFFRTVSQTRVQYEDSELSEGAAAHLRAGDRLPWVEPLDNFAPLASLDWQVHVYGEPAAAAGEACERLGLPLHRFGYSEAAHDAGLARDALLLVRPDGYVALIAANEGGAALEAYAREHGLRFAEAPAAAQGPA